MVSFDILHSRIMYSCGFRVTDDEKYSMPWFQVFQGQIQALTYQGEGTGDDYADFLEDLQKTRGEALMLFVWSDGSEVGVVRVSNGKVKGIDLDTLLTDKVMFGKVREVLSWKSLSLG